MKSVIAAAVAGLTVAGLVVGAPRAHADDDAYIYAMASEFYFVKILGPQKLLAEGHKVCDATSDGVATFDVITMVQADLSVPLYTAQQIVSSADRELC